MRCGTDEAPLLLYLRRPHAHSGPRPHHQVTITGVEMFHKLLDAGEVLIYARFYCIVAERMHGRWRWSGAKDEGGRRGVEKSSLVEVVEQSFSWARRFFLKHPRSPASNPSNPGRFWRQIVAELGLQHATWALM